MSSSGSWRLQGNLGEGERGYSWGPRPDKMGVIRLQQVTAPISPGRSSRARRTSQGVTRASTPNSRAPSGVRTWRGSQSPLPPVALVQASFPHRELRTSVSRPQAPGCEFIGSATAPLSPRGGTSKAEATPPVPAIGGKTSSKPRPMPAEGGVQLME